MSEELDIEDEDLIPVEDVIITITRKGYVNRIRSEEDKRVVKLSLTDKGRSAYYHHEQFHRHMIDHIKDGLSDTEMTEGKIIIVKTIIAENKFAPSGKLKTSRTIGTIIIIPTKP